MSSVARLCSLSNINTSHLCTRFTTMQSMFQRGFKDLKILKDSNSPTFEQLFKNSPAVRVGNIKGKAVVGKIVHRVKDDIYVDYGGKFECVCKIPVNVDGRRKMQNFEVGSKIHIHIQDHELTARFMGSDTDMTLLEASGILVEQKKDTYHN